MCRNSGGEDRTRLSDYTVRISNVELNRARSPWKLTGVLHPATPGTKKRITIVDDMLLVGRQADDAQAEATTIIDDPSVSRVHARISRVGDDFFLQDLNSSNGTFVDGVPIVSCMLSNGDAVQLGHNLFYFYRVHQPA